MPGYLSNRSISQLGVDLYNLFSLQSASSLIAASTALPSGESKAAFVAAQDSRLGYEST